MRKTYIRAARVAFSLLLMAIWLSGVPTVFAQQVVKCHSGGIGTIAQCQAKDAQAQAQQIVQCHSGGSGTIAQCQAKDAQAQAQQIVHCHSGGSGTIAQCQAKDAQAQAQQIFRCRSGGTGTAAQCLARDQQAQAQSMNQNQIGSPSIGNPSISGPSNACSTPQFAGQIATACEPPLSTTEKKVYGAALGAVAVAPVALAAGEWIVSEYAAAQGMAVVVTTLGRHIQTGYKWTKRAFTVEAHHPIPTMLGGAENGQVMYNVPGSLHMVYHNKFLIPALRAMGLPVLRSTAQWANFINLNPNSLQLIRQAIQSSAAEFDAAYGQQLLAAVLRNL